MSSPPPCGPGARPTDNLASLLARFEGRRVDFKEEVSDTFYKLLSAFANTAGGTAVIGVRDSDHAVTGIDLRNNAQKKTRRQHQQQDRHPPGHRDPRGRRQKYPHCHRRAEQHPRRL